MHGTVMVTGAGGFVGSAVVRRLVRSFASAPPRFSDGARVDHVVAALRPGSSPERLAELPPSKLWSIESADLSDRVETLDLVRRIRPRAILHAAVDQSIHQPLTAAQRDRLTITPLDTLLAGLAEVGGERFIHTSSAWVLPAGTRLAESSPLDARTPYAMSKARADELLPLLCERTGIPWITLRLFNIFGRYEPKQRLLPSLVDQLSRGAVAQLSSGTQVRDFTDVEDVAGAYMLALRADQSACRSVYHIGSGRGVSIRQFALMVEAYFEDSKLIHFGATKTPDQDIAVQIAHAARARQILGWVPSQRLEDGVRQTVQWWLDRLGRSALSST